jgi:Ca-activated chloride channel family protein
MQLPVTFLYPWLLLLVVAVVPLLWLQRRRQSAIGHSGIGIHKNVRSIPIVGRLPAIFLCLAFVALVAALARPVIPEVSENRTIDTRDICIAVDISGSMSGALPPPTQPSTTTTPAPANGTGTTSSQQTYRRLDAARDAVVQFVEARKDDRIAVLVFDDQSYFYWPLSDDHKIVQRKAQLINSYTGGGTNFEGPSETNKGIGPFQACIDHFREYGKAKSKVIVLVTDGEDNISDKRQREIAAQLEEVGVKLYVLGVGEGWTNGASTPVLGQFADKVGGKVYRVGDQGAMQQSFADINALEKSAISIEKNTSYLDVFQYFLMAALVLLALFLGSVVVTREDA